MKEVHAYVRCLKRDFPLRLPVSVRTHRTIVSEEHPQGFYGSCNLVADRFVIDISRHFGEDIAVETLFHEWVHAMLWPQCRVRHSKRFWATYGRIYQRYHE